MKYIAFMNPLTGGLSYGSPNYNGRSPGRPEGLTDDQFCVSFAEKALTKAHIGVLTKELGIVDAFDPRIETEVLPNIPASFTEGVDYHIIDEAAIPEELFRDAWEWNGGITTNMPKARGMHMDRIRIARNAELAKKDIEFMRAIEANDGSQTTIAAEKQVLRDIPQTFDLTTDTPEELNELWPEGLPRSN